MALLSLSLLGMVEVLGVLEVLVRRARVRPRTCSLLIARSSPPSCHCARSSMSQIPRQFGEQCD
jgi:hypothetical protein